MANKTPVSLQQIAHQQRVSSAVSHFVINMIAVLAILFSIAVALDTAVAAPLATSAIIEQTDPATTSSILSGSDAHSETTAQRKQAPTLATAMVPLTIMGATMVAVGIGICRKK